MTSPSLSAPSEPFCILIPAGPGANELERLADLLDSCLAFADLPLCVVVINDGNDADAIARLGAARGLPIAVRPNARLGRGSWWVGGLDVAMIDAMRWIAVHQPCCAVLRLDTDALVIGPYAREIAGRFAAEPALGMMGNYDSPTGAPVPPGQTATARLYWRSKRVSHDREAKRIIFSFWGWRRKIRLLIRQAMRYGYVLGHWCQGGGYAVSPAFLRRLAADPFFARPEDFMHVDLCEDVLMTLAVYSFGLRIHYTTGPARLFASQWKGLPAAPEVLERAGHAVIHSIKSHSGRSEQEIRTYFRASRARRANGQNLPVPPRHPGPTGLPAADSASPLCILVPFGPGPKELERLDDLMNSCATYGDRPLHFIIVNDGNDADALARMGVRHSLALTVRTNPRAGRGIGWMGGMLVGELDALRWIALNLPCCGVLKVDTDALVINPCAKQIADTFAGDCGIGLMGNFDSATGAPQSLGHSITTVLFWRSKLVSRDLELKRVIVSFWGWRKRIRHLIQRALRNGYPLGDWCQGGGYALSPEFLRRLVADPFFTRPLDFVSLDFGEDVFMAVATHALGLRIHFTTGATRLFASKWKGLAATPADLDAAGHAVIHSVKSHQGWSEAEIRSYFQARRRSASSA